ncbi:hypothetical protein [Planococcus sp. SSTMD024]|uniref:hypothetical protein n=1 Tax=Planococcus sp. SSTMD024 TaxID=3242163 RepID=UPI00351F208D
MNTLLKIISIILLFSPAVLIYTETTSILIAVIPFVLGALLYTYVLSKKRTQHHPS